MSETVHVEVLTKPGCHLCAEALATTEAVCAEFGLSFTETTIEHDAALAAQFAEEVPVLRINGTIRDFWKFDPARLRRLLAEATA
ncbi:glutaredoxin family protein [Nesterenkonia ebinurensis]|uniref:glutaredoxin family protein n=1 Tax=Nesterenkonia ebinurensis TaxID=2608252 RepID=UPI00123C7F7E|nr:glutaredoxin family protein [Nesterenkonia ebinurensis]